MISISLYHQYTRNIATALGIGYVLAVDDEQVTAQIPDSADPVLVAIIPSDDTADSLTADNMSEASTSLLFIVSPIKADTDTAEFFARHQLLTEKCKKLMMLYADAYPSLLGIKENRISSDPITGQFSGNMAGYILSFSLSNPATFYAETVPDIPGIDPASAYIEIADVAGLMEALAGKAQYNHRHSATDIDGLEDVITSQGTRYAIVADVAAGGVKLGDTIPAGTDITALAERLFLPPVSPTFTAPTLGLTAIMTSHANDALPASMECGEIRSIKLTALLNRGSINGARVAGVWQTAAVQNPRSGERTAYIIAGTDATVGGYIELYNRQILAGANTFNATADYAEGPQPLDSKGLPYSTPLAPGTVAKSVTCNGLRGHFYGTYSDSAAVDATRIRALAGKGTGAANGNTFSIAIPAGAMQVIFAYPATLRAVSSVKHVEGLGAEVKGVFAETAIDVPGANGYSPIPYRLYIYTPAVAFSSAQTYNVTI